MQLSAPLTPSQPRPLVVGDRALTQQTLDDLGIKADIVYDATQLHTSGAHAIYKGVNAQGQKVILKDNSDIVNLTPNPVMNRIVNPALDFIQKSVFPNSGRLQNINDILMRQIFKDNIDCPVIPAKEAVWLDPNTHQLHFGIETPFVDHMGSVVDQGAPPISNPMQAARGLIYSSLLMGNWDNQFHEDNNTQIQDDGHMSDGTPLHKGEYVMSDLGWGGQKGNTILGMPMGSLQLMHDLPSEDLQKVVTEMTHLSDQQIQSWVDKAGEKAITGWNPQLSAFYTNALIHNRDVVARNVARNPNWLHQPLLESMRGAHEMLAQTILSPFASVPKYIDMATSGVLKQVTPDSTMAQQVMAAMRPYPSQEYTITPQP